MGCDGEIDDMLRIRLHEAGLDEEIFTSVAWIRAFNINELIYAELCHKFYSTYEFDELSLRRKILMSTLKEEPNFEGDLQNDYLWFISKDDCYDKIQKNDLWLLSMFDARHQNRSRYDYIRDLINSHGKLIQEDPQPGVPRVGILRPPTTSMQDLYDMMGRMGIHQDVIERMKNRKSYR
nr:hypothetical protein [Tanacetum cinerariifolium]